MTEKGWRSTILSSFPEEAARAFPLTVVHDPDGLLADHDLLHEIANRGFVPWVYDEPIAFRQRYELNRAKRTEAGNAGTALVVISHGNGLQDLPFDILSRARVAHREITLQSSDLFPGISASALAGLGGEELDALFEAVEEHHPERLSYSASQDFILRHVYRLDPDAMSSEVELLAGLSAKHLRDLVVPYHLEERFIERLGQNGAFDGWPLDLIVPSRDAFLTFLQERWPAFLHSADPRPKPNGVRENMPQYGMTVPGPTHLPFADPSVRGWMAALFLEGLLQPIPWEGHPDFLPSELKWGISEQGKLWLEGRIAALAKRLEEEIPDQTGSHRDWLSFAPRWAELWALRNQTGPLDEELRVTLGVLCSEVDTTFAEWMSSRYASLIQLPPTVMLHHVMRHLQKRLGLDPGRRIALLVLDGMAWTQWIPIRKALRDVHGLPVEEERGTFAWVPTITPVSRQALFSGKIPSDFPDTIGVTTKDQDHWRRYWKMAGISPQSVAFVLPKHLEPAEETLGRLRDAASAPSIKTLAMIVPTIDEMAHGAVNGGKGVQVQTEEWANHGWLGNGIAFLRQEGFEVWITSDHGNVEYRGAGQPKEGAIVEQRGVRARAFSDPHLRESVRAGFPNSLEWHPLGLPEDYLPLLASGRSAFAPVGQVGVSHGGITLEEVIVPLIRIPPNEPE